MSWLNDRCAVSHLPLSREVSKAESASLRNARKILQTRRPISQNDFVYRQTDVNVWGCGDVLTVVLFCPLHAQPEEAGVQYDAACSPLLVKSKGAWPVF